MRNSCGNFFASFFCLCVCIFFVVCEFLLVDIPFFVLLVFVFVIVICFFISPATSVPSKILIFLVFFILCGFKIVSVLPCAGQFHLFVCCRLFWFDLFVCFSFMIFSVFSVFYVAFICVFVNLTFNVTVYASADTTKECSEWANLVVLVVLAISNIIQNLLLGSSTISGICFNFCLCCFSICFSLVRFIWFFFFSVSICVCVMFFVILVFIRIYVNWKLRRMDVVMYVVKNIHQVWWCMVVVVVLALRVANLGLKLIHSDLDVLDYYNIYHCWMVYILIICIIRIKHGE